MCIEKYRNKTFQLTVRISWWSVLFEYANEYSVYGSIIQIVSDECSLTFASEYFIKNIFVIMTEGITKKEPYRLINLSMLSFCHYKAFVAVETSTLKTRQW